MALTMGGYGGYGGYGGMPMAAPTMLDLKITVQNLAPEAGTFLTPLWFGVHDGSFDLFNVGEPASEALERIAEDGTIDPLSEAFDASGAGAAQGVVFGEEVEPIGPFSPAEMGMAEFTVEVDASMAGSYYLSYAAMVLPSNDAFIGNSDPVAYPIVVDGEFVGTSFMVAGARVYDAGTEVNDEIPENTAFFGQMEPDTGVDENGVVELHVGFNDAGSGGILDTDTYANADFTVDGYQMVYITVEKA